MNTVALRTVGKYLGAWGAIVLCVVLLSCLFTFLGTITCAVLVGMMLGAFKGARWFSAAVSLVFPGVIFGMVRGAKVDLTSQQVVLLEVLCFGVFWATYLVSAFLFFCEQKERKAPRLLTSELRAQTPVQAEPVSCFEHSPAAAVLEAGGPSLEPRLAQLQGNWVREASGAGGPACQRVIQIKDARLELKAIDASGRITLVASGDVTLQALRPS